MSAITSDNMAKMTARAGIGRAGVIRAGCAPPVSQLTPDSTGEIIFNRANDADGDPIYSTATWTNLRGEA